jgi:ATP-dependent Clp protease ATP-binding subunit ClpX
MLSGPDHCSFCNKHKDLVQKLIVSESSAICNECVDLCQNLLDDSPVNDVVSTSSSKDPRSIKDYLDQYVIGQEMAKISLSVAIVNHYKRLKRSSTDPFISKANILMIGPTGSGKTLLAKSVAKYLDVPFVIADATSITEAGYVGDDVETLISRLFANSGYDINKTQRGIVFVDEIDKISRKSESASITRDVSGEGVQQALLKLVEGTQCRVPPQPGRKHPGSEMIEVDTSDILFIAGGAFVGLDSVIKQRLQGGSAGFTAKIKTLDTVDLADTMPDDLVRYGLIPEFVGRFPTVVSLEKLTKKDMFEILTSVKDNYIEQYQWLFRQDGVTLGFDTDALDMIIDRAYSFKTGARALQSEVERVLTPHMFNIHDYKNRGINHIDINIEMVNNPSPLQE